MKNYKLEKAQNALLRAELQEKYYKEIYDMVRDKPQLFSEEKILNAEYDYKLAILERELAQIEFDEVQMQTKWIG